MKPITADADILQEAREYWEERFPGKGEELVELLAPFHEIQEKWMAYRRPFPLRRELEATEELENRCHKAVFWREWYGLSVHRREDSIEGSLEDIYETLEGSLTRYGIKTDLWYSLGRDHWEGLTGWLSKSLWCVLSDSFGGLLSTGLWASLFYACGYLITDNEEKTDGFRELLGLWAEGIILAGFDGEDRLIIFSPPAEPVTV